MKILNFIKTHKWIVIITAIASFLRLYHLNFQSMWMDEIYTMNITNPKFSLLEMHNENVLRDGFPDFYFLLLRFFYCIFGYSELTARLVSALAGIGGVLAIYIYCKEISNKRVGLIAAFLLAINDFHIYYSQEARPYSLFLLTVILAFYQLSIYIKKPNIKSAIWYGLACGLVLNVNFFGIIILFSHFIIVLHFIYNSDKLTQLKHLKQVVIAGIIAILLLLINYQMFVKLIKFKSFWVPPPTADAFGLLLKEMLGNSEILTFIFSLIFIFFIVKIFNLKQDKTENNSLQYDKINNVFYILFTWFTSFILIIYIRSLTGVSLFLPRYFISVLPVIIIIFALSINFIQNKFTKNMAILTIALFSILNLLGAKKYYTNINKTQFRETAEFVIENNKNKDVVFTNLQYWFDYYLNKNEVKTNLINKPLDEVVKAMIDNKTPKTSFWHIDAFGYPFKINEETKNFLNTYYIVSNEIDLYDSWAKHFVLKTDTNAISAIKITSKGYTLSAISDENWTGGVGVSNKTLLMDFSSEKENILKTAKTLKFSNGKTATVKGYQVLGNFIHIYINEEINDYKEVAIYPNVIEIN